MSNESPPIQPYTEAIAKLDTRPLPRDVFRAVAAVFRHDIEGNNAILDASERKFIMNVYDINVHPKHRRFLPETRPETVGDFRARLWLAREAVLERFAKRETLFAQNPGLTREILTVLPRKEAVIENAFDTADNILARYKNAADFKPVSVREILARKPGMDAEAKNTQQQSRRSR